MPLPTEVVNLTTTVQYNEFARNNFSSEYTIRRQIYILKKTNFDLNSFDIQFVSCLIRSRVNNYEQFGIPFVWECNAEVKKRNQRKISVIENHEKIISPLGGVSMIRTMTSLSPSAFLFAIFSITPNRFSSNINTSPMDSSPMNR